MKKMHGDERRQTLLHLLKNANKPLTGSELAKLVQVSRQVIVNDMNLLKAMNEPILSTSQGYIYFQETPQHLFEKKIVCHHTPEQTLEELYSIVDCGVTIKDVSVEHPVYGEITAAMYLSSRFDADLFVEKLTVTKAPLLSELTDGTHVHTIMAANELSIEKAISSLRQKGFLIEN